MADQPLNPDGTKARPRLTAAHGVLLLLLFTALYFVFRIIQPYLNAIILAVILATVTYPVHNQIEKHLKNRRNLAALISCVLLVLILVIPVILITSALIQQGIQSFNAIQGWLAAGNLEELLKQPPVRKVVTFAVDNLPGLNQSQLRFDQDLVRMSSGVGKFLLDQGGFIVGNVTAFIGKFFLMIFVFFFMVRDGESILNGLLHLLPLSGSQESQIIDKIKSVSQSALLGTLVTAAAQGVAGGIAFWICGLPGLFWGTMIAFASLIPVVGTALIWVPAAGYLFLSAHWGYGVFMLAWSIGVVGSIDNFLRPVFMKGSAGMSPVLILFAILGGINLFGLIGILYGPLIFGIALVLIYIYQLEFEEYLKAQDTA
ncbi:AI-2E family transporter [bacterium]|nr:AI-2E family transporter [candidate division CSSED10-310 bacterium]